MKNKLKKTKKLLNISKIKKEKRLQLNNLVLIKTILSQKKFMINLKHKELTTQITLKNWIILKIAQQMGLNSKRKILIK